MENIKTEIDYFMDKLFSHQDQKDAVKYSAAGQTCLLTISRQDHYIPADTNWLSKLQEEHFLILEKKKSDLIKSRLKEVIIDIEDKDADWIKEHLSVIFKEDDKYSHYYYDFGKDTEIRVISIQRSPSVMMDGNTCNAKINFY